MRSSSFLVAGFVLGALGAQEPATSSAIVTGHGLWHEAGVLCGAGPGYRVEFRDSGATYIPALAEAPGLFPFRLSFESLQQGGVRVVPAAASEPARSENSAIYQRGRGVAERYDLSAHGVEQSFVLQRPLGGDGDIVVRLRIDTELVPVRTGDVSGGMRWMAERWGGVSVGRAIARDAMGREFAMSMHCDGRHLELLLPQASARDARYPLVLDPPLDTVKGISGTRGDTNPDIAYDATTDRYLVVWNRRLSGTQSEIYGHLLDGTGLPFGGLIAIQTGGVFAVNPAVANVDASDRFMVVWQQGPGVIGPWDLHGRVVDPTGAQSAAITITGGGANEIDPDLGGTSRAGNSRIPLVWHRVGQGIRSLTITVPATGNPQQSQGATTIHDGVVRRPRISSSGGSRGRYAVVWEAEPTSGNPFIEAALASENGSRISSVTRVSGGTSAHRRASVDGDGDSFLAVYERVFSQSSRDVICRGIRLEGGVLVTSAERRVGTASGDQITPAVGWLGPKFMVAWATTGSTGNFLDYDVHVLSMSPDCEVCDDEHTVRRVDAYDHDPAIATKRSGGSTATDGVVAFSVVEDAGLRTSVRSQRFGAFGPGGSASVRGPGCGNGGTLRVAGPLSYGNVELTIELQGADPGATAAALFLGFTDRNFPCGSCTIVDPVLSLPAPIQNGAASQLLPLSCSLFGTRPVADLQWVMIGAAGAPCAVVPSLATSDRVQISVDV